MNSSAVRIRVAPRRLALASISALLLAATFVCWATPATAQVGLGEVLETQNIRNEATGQGGRGRAANDPAEAEDPATDAAEENADGEGAEADGEAAPEESSFVRDEWNDKHSIFRQTEFSLSWLKLLPIVLLFLAWVRSCDWVNRDAQLFGLGHTTWNPVMVAPFAIAFLVAVFIPNYLVGLSLLTVAWLGPFIAYVVHHNKSVEGHQTVFTGSWFRYQSALLGRKIGLKIDTEKRAGYLRGPDVELTARGGDERTDQGNLLTARQSPGYVHVKELVAEMVQRGSSRALLDYMADSVGVRYTIDGVWHPGEPRDRESGDVMLAVMKQLANLNVSERQKKQDGEFGAAYQGKKYDCEVSSQGVKSGERVIVSLRGQSLKAGFGSLEELGMREKLREQWLRIMNSESGVIVYAAMPEGGLTTLTDIGLTETDRLLRDFFALEDKNEPESDIENIQPHFYDAAKGESPAPLIPSLSRKYPNVWVVRDLVDAKTAELMMDEVELDRLLITTVHAKDAAEACLRVLKKKFPHKGFARTVIGVLGTRLIRKLCTDCRVGYDATPALLKKLGIPPGKVAKFYRPPKPEEVQKPCPACAGIGYRGRTGLFELLEPDDQFREKLLKEPQPETLRKAARSAGMRTFQEEGILLVAKGVTSLQELQRVLKE